ncbi:MAG: hypothetical protein MUF21_06290, partial [Gemmatimonadaceae bacterium]|nr:hypothetical protein [Gemmatimonadaceae bacterium]
PVARWEVRATDTGPLEMRTEPVRAADRIVCRVLARTAGNGDLQVTLFDPASLLTRMVVVPLRVRAAGTRP